jgi:hypothetical protein
VAEVLASAFFLFAASRLLRGERRSKGLEVTRALRLPASAPVPWEVPRGRGPTEDWSMKTGKREEEGVAAAEGSGVSLAMGRRMESPSKWSKRTSSSYSPISGGSSSTSPHGVGERSSGPEVDVLTPVVEWRGSSPVGVEWEEGGRWEGKGARSDWGTVGVEAG